MWQQQRRQGQQQRWKQRRGASSSQGWLSRGGRVAGCRWAGRHASRQAGMQVRRKHCWQTSRPWEPRGRHVHAATPRAVPTSCRQAAFLEATSAVPGAQCGAARWGAGTLEQSEFSIAHSFAHNDCSHSAEPACLQPQKHNQCTNNRARAAEYDVKQQRLQQLHPVPTSRFFEPLLRTLTALAAAACLAGGSGGIHQHRSLGARRVQQRLGFLAPRQLA